ncbi:hypothetical protein H8E07_13500 [bacterium]|nr:hypothetical protein [bacterium]
MDTLYDAIEGLTVTGYAWADSDGWQRTRGPLVDGAPLHHLEHWIDLGGIQQISGSEIVHDSSLVYACRYVQEDDARSQARLHASLRDLWSLLLTWGIPADGVRTRPLSSTIESAEASWLVVTVRFNTYIPWRA